MSVVPAMQPWVDCRNCGFSFPIGVIDTDGLLKIEHEGKLYAPDSNITCPHCHLEFPVEGTKFTVQSPDEHSLVRRGIFRQMKERAEEPPHKEVEAE